MSLLYKLKDIKYYKDEKRILDIRTLELKQGEIIGVFGPNGSGKSTLFSLLSFIEKPTSGELYFQECDIRKIEFIKKQSVVILPQNPYLLKRSVFENIAYGLHLRKDKINLENRVYEALNQVGLQKSFAKRSWSQLSGGETQRVALAARLILKPQVLILDEPTSAVDTNSAQLIKEAVFQARQKWNTSLIISSHDHNWLNHTCDTKIGLFQGKVIKNSGMNLLFAPWKKDENNNLVKEFLDGQRLILENSSSKKRDSIAMICSTNIDVFNKTDNGLKAKVISMYKEPKKDEMIVELLIGGVCLNSTISKDKIKNIGILPGSEVEITINTKKILWI